ncbi:MAG: type II toxin-antitoxin system RelB/DinJ family antitoxin [Gordonibacter sp.]|nr:type II toxin-antitoxin system RelB/DinJ family antitoxin [Gordonibacter sp.]
MTAVQMNIRIDSDLKQRGDEVIARKGFTPSQVVRAVWEYVDETGDLPVPLRKRSTTDAEEDAERQRGLALVEEGSHIWENFFKDHGLAVPTALERTPYKELSEEMYEEMLNEMMSR